MIWRWLRRDRERPLEAEQALDADLARLFAAQSSVPLPDEASLARARARIGVELDRAPSGSGWRRRLALGSLGAGGLWASAVGMAAAHKAAATVVAVGVLAGGAAAAEAGGAHVVPPPVRDAVSAVTRRIDPPAVVVTPSITATATATPSPSPAGVAADDRGNERREDDADGRREDAERDDAAERDEQRGRPAAPAADGTFSLRAVLLGVDPAARLVRLSLDDGEAPALVLALHDGSQVQQPGPPRSPREEIEELAQAEGAVVIVTGACAPGAVEVTAACTIDRLVVTGAPARDDEDGDQTDEGRDDEGGRDGEDDRGPPGGPPGLGGERGHPDDAGPPGQRDGADDAAPDGDEQDDEIAGDEQHDDEQDDDEQDDDGLPGLRRGQQGDEREPPGRQRQ